MNSRLEHVLMTFYKEGMIAFMHETPEAFEEAIALAVENKQPYSWRAAWLLWSCIDENDSRLQKHIKTIISSLKGKDDGHQRELLKILYIMELSDEDEGYLFDFCISIWEKVLKKPSVRIMAFKFILKIARKYPELKEEISFLTENRFLETLSPGIKNSVLKMISVNSA